MTTSLWSRFVRALIGVPADEVAATDVRTDAEIERSRRVIRGIVHVDATNVH